MAIYISSGMQFALPACTPTVDFKRFSLESKNGVVADKVHKQEMCSA